MYYNEYDEPDVFDIWGEKAEEYILDEIDARDEEFIDWAYDKDHLPEAFTDADIDAIVKDSAVRKAYVDYRYETMVFKLAEGYADNLAYQQSEAASAARERMLGL